MLVTGQVHKSRNQILGKLESDKKWVKIEVEHGFFTFLPIFLSIFEYFSDLQKPLHH